MKKKIFKFNIHLLAALLCLALISCGGGDSEDPDKPSVKNASQLTQSDFNVANAKSLSETEFRAESNENPNFKNMDESAEAKPDNDINNNNSVSSQFSLSSAGSESFDECFDRKTAVAVFQPNENGGFKAALDNTEIGDCFGSYDISIIFSFAYDQVKVRDLQGAEVNLQGMAVSELFDPSNNFTPFEFNIREHAYLSGYGNSHSIMASAHSASNFNAPCVISENNRVSGCEIQIAERASYIYGESFNNSEILKINEVTANLEDSYFTNGTVDFVINDWEGVMTYDGNGSTPPSWTATNTRTGETASGIYSPAGF